MPHSSLDRTKRYKTLSILASTISTASFVAILLRWRGRIEIWESLYLSPAALAIGLLNSSQFVALSAAVEKEHLATIISTYFLSLQLGILIGASASASLLRVVFGTTLAGLVGKDVPRGGEVRIQACSTMLDLLMD